MVTRSKIYFILLAGFVTLTGRAGAEADFLRHYKEGLDAIETQNWRRAGDLMRQAISERAEESRRLPKQLYLKPYLPYFYLGLAQFKQGDCDGALASWSISEQQGVVRKRPQYQQIELAREMCRARQRPQDAASTKRAAPEEPVASPRPVAPSPPPPREPSLPPPQPARRENSIPANEESGSAFSDRRSSTPPPPPEPGFDFRRGERPAEPPNAGLLEAAAALFSGSYQQVLDRLAESPPDDPYSRAHAHLLAAAAEFALYLASGEREGQRLDSAREHVLEVRRSLPDLEPPERYFSPRFLDFFYGQRHEETRR